MMHFISSNEQKWEGEELGNELWKFDETKDFSIIAAENGKEIKVHKTVLCISSEFFASMFNNSNMAKLIENYMVIPDFSFKVVEAGIKLIYHCTFTSTLSIDELMELLRFLDKYQFPKLKAKIEPFLISQISASNVVRLTNCSIQTNSFKLKEKCMELLSAAFQSKLPLSDIDDLDNNFLQNYLCQSITTLKL